MDSEDKQLREKARLLLQRERELFELRLKHDQVVAWLSVGQSLPLLFADRAASLHELCDRVRRMLLTKLRLQRVFLLEIDTGTLRSLAPAGQDRALPEDAARLLETRPSGYCNDPEECGVTALAAALGLHRFVWSKIARAGDLRILMVAGFDRRKAEFQSPFVASDAAQFSNAAQHVESLLGNALLVSELERERDRLQRANSELEQRDRALQTATEELRAANESLERRVRERTQELAGKNSELRLVLDNVDQALVTIDLEGHLAPERSRAMDRWFGPYTGRPRFIEHVPANRRFASAFKLGLEALRDDILPRELCLYQMPKRLAVDVREFECHYLPISENGTLTGLLLVIDDVTERLARAREEAEQRELLAAFSALMRDRTGFLTFFDESERALRGLSQEGLEQSVQKRILHTLKGNASVFGLNVIAELCHRAETELADDARVRSETLQELRTRWAGISHTMKITSSEIRNSIQISEQDFEKIAELARVGASGKRIVTELEKLRWEPVERPLRRLAQHAEALSKRLGKGTLEIQVDTDDIRLDSERWAPLWSALIHIVRNAVDHGVESPEQRSRAGKPPCAKLRIAASRLDSRLCIEIEDDGAGIDWPSIQRLCQQKGHPSATRADLVEAIVAPHFSTKAVVTETSGRGIGLAVVVAITRELCGVFAVDSEPGRGTCWRLTFPTGCDAGSPLQ